MSATPSSDTHSLGTVDAVVVGAGFSGLYMLHKLRELGLSARLFEAASGVGGTWWWNRYPGARVDIESMEYSYSFSEELEAEWEWSERYATQPELLAYLDHVAERFDLKRDIQFDTRVTAASFDETVNRWMVETDRGHRVSARYCVMATGCLSVANVPDFPGLESFTGKTYQTGCWPHEGVDFTGQRVGVIGTGSSAIQSIPRIAEQAAHLYVFQRTPNFSVPAHNGPFDPAFLADWKANRAQYRREGRENGFGIRALDTSEQLAVETPPEERQRIYEDRWARGGFSLVGAFADLIFDPAANATAAEFVGSKIREIVKDPQVAEALFPKSYPIATKRLCVDTDYYATFNRDNVTLVAVAAAPIEAVTSAGLRTTDAEYELDSIVFAIGFDAMTGALNSIDIRGRGGVALKDRWAEGPRTYLGLMVAGFPNLFIVTGPGSPSVLCNMAVAIEQHVGWIADCIAHLSGGQLAAIEATDEAQDAWVAHVNEVAEMTLYPLANSWYIGANVPGKPHVFMPYIGGFPAYREKCEQVAAGGYEGFALSSAAS
ncbi:MAG: NAD(P)/FAD-dependent oxidoreductase [Phenylobacterium sp.]|uniref:flavin-containing monooxygenase n=1 Tax=Phenylobacterium sp. TaxID=1871053 RepID=UPI002734B302|nr:NAD(P)/FAD-dependent oxidoreductase [Phenylobacterium sp.]MDP3747895.1 NAD(P)/FAD-dependent oxidoreductase [Phenylobacterium sp.]